VLFLGQTEPFFRPAIPSNLVSNWIPTLESSKRLKAGARVADVVMRPRRSTIVNGAGLPHSEVFGFDDHKPSMNERGPPLWRRKRGGWETASRSRSASAKIFSAKDYMIWWAFFDCLHDWRPTPCAATMSKTLAGRVVDDRRAVCS